jgi:hypothetical protein
MAQIQSCWSALRRRGCGCLSCNKGNCCRKHRSSATSSALGLRVAEKGPDEKANHPGPYRNGLISCDIPVAGCGFFAFPQPNIDGSCLFGLTLDFLRSLSKVPLISLLNGRPVTPEVNRVSCGRLT